MTSNALEPHRSPLSRNPLSLAGRSRFVPSTGWHALRVLHCAAGFYRSAEVAELIAGAIRKEFQLSSQQVSLLRPEDASNRRYHQLSRQWAQKPPAEPSPLANDRWMGSALGAIVVGSLFTAWAASESTLVSEAQLMLAVAGSVMGALLGLGLAMMLPALRRQRRFDRTVQRQLAGGNWAVVVSQVPRPQQVALVKGLRETAHRWCAEAPHQAER